MVKAHKIIFVSYLLLFTFYSYSQNLVNNPSFETYTSCPTTLDQIYKASGWSSYGITPDYFNSCNTVGLGVPSNGIGFQNAFSGNAYAGFVAYDIGGQSREIIGGLLTQTLSIGTKYYISLRFSLAEFDANTKQYVPCDKVGARLSTVPFSTLTPAPINNFAHVYSTKIISDTLNWTVIKGAIIADSAYKYIMIGNFFDHANTDTTYRPSGIRSYFYVDDICLSTDSNNCYNNTSINKIDSYKNDIIFPNPTTSILNIDLHQTGKFNLILRNVNGDLLLDEGKNNKCTIDMSNFAPGIYFITIINNKEFITKKIIKTP